MRQLDFLLRSTSLAAYREVQPHLGGRQQTVLQVLNDGPKTNSEIGRILGWSINRVTPRVYELRKRGLVREFCRRKCSVTGRRAIVWAKI